MSVAVEDFLVKSGKVIERALIQSRSFDIMRDYSADDHADGDANGDSDVTSSCARVYDGTSSSVVASSSKQPLFVFRDLKWTKGRAVTDIDTSPFYDDLCLVAYNARGFLEDMIGSLDPSLPSSSSSTTLQDTSSSASSSSASASSASASLPWSDADANGAVLLWSSALPNHPEYKFTCSSQVMSACFHPFDRHILIGGTYTGQVCMSLYIDR
jgi:dynein intermediate chain